MKPIQYLALATFTISAHASERSPHFEIHGEHQLDAFPLKSSHSKVTITGPIAQVELTQTYTNHGDKPIDATYFFPASTKAAVHGMTMTIGDRTIIAEIQEKEKARQTFEKAKKQNKSASLLTQSKPNIFSMEVARILPGDVLSLTLNYSEILVPNSSLYELVIPTAIGPRYREGKATEATITNPFLGENASKTIPTRFSVDLDLSSPLPIQSLACPSHEQAKITFNSKTQATLNLPATNPDRDFILRYQLADQKIQSGLLTHQGEDENTFLLQIEPPTNITPQDIPERDFIFVIDVSGSMKGFPLGLAKELFHDLTTTLRPEDRFNMLLFAGANELLSPQSLPANSTNIAKAVNFLKNARGNGGTRLLNALDQALALSHNHDRSRTLVLISDGYIAAEGAVFDLIKDKSTGTNIFPLGVGSSVNRHLIEGLSHFAGHDHYIVTHSTETDQAKERFCKAISTPVLTNIQITGEGLTLSELLPARQPDLFAGQPLSLVGKWTGQSGTITMTGTTGGGEKISQSFTLNPEQKTPTLPVLWARTRVREICDFSTLVKRSQDTAEVTKLGLKYQLLTPYTSFVATTAEAREDNSKTTPIKQALPLPSGVSNSAKTSHSPTNGSVPEPSSSLLIMLVGLLSLTIRVRSH